MANGRQQHNPHATPAWPFIGMIGMAAAFFLYAASGLVAPWWAVTLLMVLWCVLFVVATRWWTPHPQRVVALPIVAVAVWFVVLNAGARWLGWTA
ncbi:hypothetical protein [Nocardioides sp. InS609-2]|uniref:hypothetical protein n=1 Tax=Nocardioides sp. InS609-2 TaxID=2760705 RepID=UPI0020BE3FAB|nr:hypothetical protein [Nocardioides sp. InS609-2]